MGTTRDDVAEVSTLPVDRLLTDYQVAELVGKKRSSLQHDRAMRRGLPYVKNGKSVYYRLSDVQDFINSLQRVPTQTSLRREAEQCCESMP